MNRTHTGLVAEWQMVTLSCTTGTANPKPRVSWKRAANEFEELSEEVKDGQYGGMMIESTVTIEANRRLNQQTYQCCLQHSTSTCSNPWTMDVRCKCKHMLKTDRKVD